MSTMNDVSRDIKEMEAKIDDQFRPVRWMLVLIIVITVIFPLIRDLP